MKAVWTAWAAARLLPFPGEAWTVKVDGKKSAARVAKAGGGEVPQAPNVADEAARAATLRVHERYNEVGNIPKDALGDDLIDLWVARAGVVFALEAAIATTRIPRIPPDHLRNYLHPYELRRDARPWGRLRQHVAAASPADRERATAAATTAWGDGAWARGGSELPFALAYLTCNQAWIDRVVAQSDDKAPRYGQQCVLAGITEPERASRLLRVCDEQPMGFQLTEEAFDFVPTLMKTLPEADAARLVTIAQSCATKAIRKPWLEIVGSLDSVAAMAFVAKHAKATR